MTERFKDETGLTRRTVMRTATWSVPVIAAAVATPMAAASGPGVLTNLLALAHLPGLIFVTADANFSNLPTLLKDYFHFEGEPAITVTSIAQYSNKMLDVTLFVSGPADLGRILTINIPGYATTTVPLTS